MVEIGPGRESPTAAIDTSQARIGGHVDAGLLCSTARSRDLAPAARLTYWRARLSRGRSSEWARFCGAFAFNAGCRRA